MPALHDIVLPPPVGRFPQGLGWYVLAALMLALVTWAWRGYRRRRAENLYRRQALAELEDIFTDLQQQGGRQRMARRLPTLLKRVALHVEPRDAVASLTDDAWLAQLDRMYDGQGFSKGPGRILARLAYGTAAAVSSVPRADLDALIRLSRDWIRKHRKAA